MSRSHTRPKRPELETLAAGRYVVVDGPLTPEKARQVEAEHAAWCTSLAPVRVARIEDDRVFLTGGILAGAKDGDLYLVCSGDVAIVDPATKEELGRAASVSLHLRVRKAYERFSECEVLSRRGPVVVGDVAESVKASVA